MTMSMTRNLERDLRSLEETILLIDADLTSDAAVKARLIEGVRRTRDRLQDVEYLVPGLYDYSGTNRFLISVRDQVHLGQKPLSQKQIDAVRRALPATVPAPVPAPVVETSRARLSVAYEVIRNSGEARTMAAQSMRHGSPVDEAIYGAANVITGRCPDGCCGGADNYENFEDFVDEVEAIAARLVSEDA